MGDRKFVVYIAGPFRAKGTRYGYDFWEQEQNIRRAEGVAREAWREGFAVLCPHANTRHFQGTLPDEIWLDGDMELLRRCDAVLVVEGYRESVGTMAELRFAQEQHIPVFEKLRELVAWREKILAGEIVFTFEKRTGLIVREWTAPGGLVIGDE